MERIIISIGRIFGQSPRVAHPDAPGRIGKHGATVSAPGIRRALAHFKREVSFAIRSRILSGDAYTKLVFRYATKKIDRRMGDFLDCLKNGRPAESELHALYQAALAAHELHFDPTLARGSADFIKSSEQYVIDAFVAKCPGAADRRETALDGMLELLVALDPPLGVADLRCETALKGIRTKACEQLENLLGQPGETLDRRHASQLERCDALLQYYGGKELTDKVKKKLLSVYARCTSESMNQVLEALKKGTAPAAVKDGLFKLSEALEKVKKVDEELVDDFLGEGIEAAVEGLSWEEMLDVLSRVSTDATRELREMLKAGMSPKASFLAPQTVLSTIRAAVLSSFEARLTLVEMDYSELGTRELTSYANLFRSYNLKKESATIDAEIIKRSLAEIDEQLALTLNLIADQAKPEAIEKQFKALARAVDSVDKRVAKSDSLLAMAFAARMKDRQLSDMIALLGVVSPENTALLRRHLNHDKRIATKAYKQELLADNSTPSSLLEIFISESVAIFNERYGSWNGGPERLQEEVQRLDDETLVAYFKILLSHNLEPQCRVLDIEGRRRHAARPAE